MTSWVVSDSGIFIARVMQEPLAVKADALIAQWIKQNFQVAAPTLFLYEVVAVVRKHVHRGTITSQEGIKRRDALVTLYANKVLVRRAYDTQYLALAEYLKCDFWTVDERLFNTVQSKLNWVKWVGNYT